MQLRYKKHFYINLYFLLCLKGITIKLFDSSFLFKNFNTSLLMNNNLNWSSQLIALSAILGKSVFIDSMRKKNSKYNLVLRLNIFPPKLNKINLNINFFFLILEKLTHIILTSLDYFDKLDYTKTSDNKFFFTIPNCSINKEVNRIILKNNKLKDYFLYSPFVVIRDLVTDYDLDIAVASFQFLQFNILKKESDVFVYTWKNNLDTYYSMKKKGLLTII